MSKERICIKTRDLISELKATREYKNFLKYKKIVNEKNLNTKKRLNQYRLDNYKIQTNNNYSPFEMYEKLKQLKESYIDLINDRDIVNFLDAEVLVSKLILCIYEEVAEGFTRELHLQDEDIDTIVSL